MLQRQCEVCSASCAQGVMLTCNSCGAGCHSYCLPGPHSLDTFPSSFTCWPCSQSDPTVPAAPISQPAPASPVNPPSHAVDWTQLPPEVLSAILEHVPLQERFSSCALVSTAWAAAAAAVPVLHLSTVRPTPEALKAAWDAQAVTFGAQLTSLHLGLPALAPSQRWDVCAALTELPCPRLVELKLSGITVQLAGHGQVPASSAQAPALPGGMQLHPGNWHQPGVTPSTHGVLHGVPGLTRLCLQHGSLLGQPNQHSTALAALTNLRHLDVRASMHEPDAGQGAATEPLRQLTRLTHLRLSVYRSERLSCAPLQHASHLLDLRHLGLAFAQMYRGQFHTAAVEQAMEPHAWALTKLSMLTSLTLNSAPHVLMRALAASTTLQKLVLVHCNADASALQGLTHLQEVQLDRCRVGNQDGTAALLSWLQQQDHLEVLRINHLTNYARLWHAPPEAYAALTASSNLRELHLETLVISEEACSGLQKEC